MAFMQPQTKEPLPFQQSKKEWPVAVKKKREQTKLRPRRENWELQNLAFFYLSRSEEFFSLY